jgi:hypothetical protein
VAAVADYTDFLAGIPRLAALGPVFKSTAAVQLTEEETEYSILGIKHIFEEHILFQFNCTNTVPEQILENVSVLMDLAEAVSQLSLPPSVVVFPVCQNHRGRSVTVSMAHNFSVVLFLTSLM